MNRLSYLATYFVPLGKIAKMRQEYNAWPLRASQVAFLNGKNNKRLIRCLQVLIWDVLRIELARDHRLKIANIRPEYDAWPPRAFVVAFWIHETDKHRNILSQTSKRDILPIVSVSTSVLKSVLKSRGIARPFSFLPL